MRDAAEISDASGPPGHEAVISSLLFARRFTVANECQTIS